MPPHNKWQVSVDRRYCSGCGICIDVCPRRVLIRGEEFSARGVCMPRPVDIAACSGCRLCELYCGNFAIAVEQDADQQ